MSNQQCQSLQTRDNLMIYWFMAKLPLFS